MGKNYRSRICADCKHWECYDAMGSEHPEDELGRCKMLNEIVYGDDDADGCDDFKSCKRQRVRSRW